MIPQLDENTFKVLTVLFGAFQAISILMIAWQVHGQARTTRAQLLDDLDRQFAALLPEYWKIRDGYPYSDEKAARQDWYKFFSFFEKCRMLIKIRAIRESDFKQMFGSRFFTLMSNPAIAAYIEKNWQSRNLILLHEMNELYLPRLEKHFKARASTAAAHDGNS